METQKIFSALSVSALQRFELSTHHVHFDTTSVNLYGEYRVADGEEAPFKITQGYSKDKRPDLKQFVLSLLCVDGDVPIVGKLEDGNASDKKINHHVLSEVSRHMQAHGVAEQAFIYIADAAMVTQENLAQAGLFITRLPATYNECERVIRRAIAADQWSEVGRIARARRRAKIAWGPTIGCMRSGLRFMTKPTGLLWFTPAPMTHDAKNAWSASSMLR